MKLHAQKLLTNEGWRHNQVLCIEQGLIAAIEEADQHNLSHVASSHDVLVPGFIDIQVNGGGDVLFNETPNASALKHMFSAHQQFGTAAMLPTLITDNIEKMQSAADAISDVRTTMASAIVGVHFEGPWLNTTKKGVHKADFIRTPVDAELAILRRSDLGKVMVTLAPENVPVEIIRQMCDDGIIVFLGHSNATAAQVEAALDAGAIGFTHLYNAMSPMQSRAPGMVGAALSAQHAYAGLIVDGYHVEPTCCHVAYLAKGKDKLILVTDAMALAASSNTDVAFFDTSIHKHKGKLSTPDGTLAGSCLTMIDAVKNACTACQIALEQSIYMASETPAKLLGLEASHGAIKVGAFAHLLALDEANNITHIWHNGKAVPKTTL
ncbi:N-acetylglucosamine-6-phosphate deacetylase [Glaciecola siphonariae]|uniref:N-acetylgalactosamine-6-phosphate deacetylase n=1 Tax=Glaciecola siphonariae TaxID=521012 RepID=A0ABV9LXG5_9ALTE